MCPNLAVSAEEVAPIAGGPISIVKDDKTTEIIQQPDIAGYSRITYQLSEPCEITYRDGSKFILNAGKIGLKITSSIPTAASSNTFEFNTLGLSIHDQQLFVNGDLRADQSNGLLTLFTRNVVITDANKIAYSFDDFNLQIDEQTQKTTYKVSGTVKTTGLAKNYHVIFVNQQPWQIAKDSQFPNFGELQINYIETPSTYLSLKAANNTHATYYAQADKTLLAENLSVKWQDILQSFGTYALQ